MSFNREKGPELFNSSQSMKQTAKIAEPANQRRPQAHFLSAVNYFRVSLPWPSVDLLWAGY